MRIVVCLMLFVSSALAAPVIDLGPDTLKFGSVSAGGSHIRPLEVANTGDSPLIVTQVDCADLAFTFLSPDLPDTIAAGQSHSYQINFGPVDLVVLDVNFVVHSNDPASPQASILAQARGVPRFSPGEIIWSYQGQENVVSSASIQDVNGDGFEDVVAESFDAGSSGDNLLCVSGSGWGTGDLHWSARPLGGPSNSGGYGDDCLITVPDINQNGSRDIILGTAWGSRSVFAIEGTTGSTIWSYDLYQNPPDGWVYTVAQMADLSGDGIPEILAGAGSDANAAYCFDGATGARRWKFTAADAVYSVASIEDVTYDSIPDVIVGSGDDGDRVYCISGTASDPATPVWTYNLGGSAYSIASITDINYDGFFDVIVGSWYNGNRVLALSGYAPSGTPAVIWTAAVGHPIMKIVICPDLNGDYWPDILVASWGSYALALNGRTGAELWRNATGDDTWAIYWSYDITGDNIPEVIAGSFTGHVILIDGFSGETVWSCATDSKIFTVRPIRDVNGDGFADIIAGQQFLSSTGGKFFVISGGMQEPNAVEDDVPQKPENALLLSSYPNPFNARTVISFELPAASDVALEIYNINGQRVRGLLYGRQEAGEHRVVWDGRDQEKSPVASGVYFTRLVTGQQVSTNKLTVLK